MSLAASFYDRPVVDVARDLIGCVVVHEGCAGLIVETEAYHQSEPACHAYVGVTGRTVTLFGPPGTAYVYRSYGIHALLNAVSEQPGTGAAVLIRALQPLDGIEVMRERRGLEPLEELCSGPGKLTQALGIEMHHNTTSLVDGPVQVLARDGPELPVVTAARVGITKAADLPWRFCAHGNPHVSRPRPANRPAQPVPSPGPAPPVDGGG